MASKKPKGLTITRKNGKYIFKWKKGETYADGERLIWGYVQVTTSGNKSTKTRWESGTVKLSGSKTDYTVNVPVTYTDIAYVYFKVRGKANGEAWSDWESETFKLKDPKEPSVSASWDSGTPNKTSFSFTAQGEDHQPYNHIEWQTILVENCPSDYKAASLWKGATKHTKSGTSGTFYNTPESALTGSWARIVRVRSIGQGGASDWRYAWHVYASPNAPYNVVVDAEYDATNQATDLTVKWDAMAPAMQRPIDTTKVQYCIGVPTSGFGLPTGASWTDVATPVNTALNVWETRLGAEIDLDECLFVRVVTVHDTHEVGSTFVCAYKRELTAPVLGTITPTKSTHTIAVAVTNGSQNPDSKTAITYRDPATGKIGVVGVIAHGGTSMNVLVPAWEDSAGTIGAFAFVGDSSQQKSTPYYVYSVNSVVESDTVWATATRTAPTITAVIKDETTVNVAWNWPWADATNAELSWADRPDAWESTNQPTTYVVNNNQQASWNITGLDEGKVYYFRVRLFYGENDENFYSDYSNTAVVDMTQPPEKPVLELSDTIVPVDGTITASWQNYEKQTYAELIETVSGVDTVRAEVASGSSVEFSPADFGWSNDSGHILSVKVYLDGTGSLKSDTVAVNVASALECVIAQDSLVYEEQELNPETYTGNPAQFDGGTEETLREITSASVALEPHQAGTPWQDSTIYQAPYLFKKTPNVNHSINSKYTTLVGADVVVNQLCGDIATQTKFDITCTNNGNGSLTFNGTSTGRAQFYQAHSAVHLNAGDKVLMLANGLTGSCSGALNIFFYFIPDDGSATQYPAMGVYGADGTLIRTAYIISVSKSGMMRAEGALVDFVNSGTTVTNLKFTPQVINLTQYFGSSTIADTAYTKEQTQTGSGIAWLKANGFDFSKYRAYNAGSLESVNPSAIKTVGFNQWDEEWEVGYWDTGEYISNNENICSKNKIRILPSTSYYLKFPANTRFFYSFYDADNNVLPLGDNMYRLSIATNESITTPDNAYYMTFNMSATYGTTYKNDICINLHWDGSRDGEYEQYSEHEYDLGNVPLHGIFKLVDGNIQAVGDTRTSDGTDTHYYGRVNLGSLNYSYSSALQRFTSQDIASLAKGVTSDNNSADCICARLVTAPVNTINTTTDKLIGIDTRGYIYAQDKAYTNGSAFATAMDGVYLVYALATPTEETTDSFTNPQVVDNWGTEEFVDTRAVAIPVGNNTRYADVYEITGTDEVDTHVRGHNQWDEQTRNGYYDTGGVFHALSGYIATANPIKVKPNTAYNLTSLSKNFGRVCWYDEDMTCLYAGVQSATAQNIVFTSPATARYLNFDMASGYGGTYKDDVSINYPSTDTTYHAYAGDDTTTALTQTVYEGTVDVVSGKLTVTRCMLNAAQIIAKYNGYNATYNRYMAYMTGADNAPIGEVTDVNSANAISDQYTCDLTWNQMSSGNAYPAKIGVYHNEAWDYTRVYIYINDSNVTTREQAEAYLTSTNLQLSYDLATPIEIDLTPNEIEALLGDNYVWSEQGEVTVRIADAVESGYYLDELPLTVTVTGAGTAGNTTMKIVRAENYAMERPDGKDYNGYEGDLIVQKVQSGEDQMTVDLTNLVGRFDDGAKYRIVATIQDELGQRSEAVKDFTVQWSHQAVIATGTAVIDGDIAKITPTKPNGARDDDYVDVYRLSCDAPELIFSHADFGDTVVDPYPTLGDTGGYRLVLVTKNGDYITEDNLPSWVDVKAGLTTQYQYIDFDGERLPLKYNVKLDETKQKTFDVTHYLGGSVQGDFLEGTEGSGTVNGTIPYMLDPADFITLRDLMRYTGLCHVRTKIGSNYVANVEVQDGSSHDGPGGMHDASLAITQVDNPELDGVLLTDWQVS